MVPGSLAGTGVGADDIRRDIYYALPEWRGGVTIVYAEADRLFIGLSSSGPCGNNQSVVPRTNTNFREMYALALMATATGRGLAVQVAACDGITNVVLYGRSILIMPPSTQERGAGDVSHVEDTATAAAGGFVRHCSHTRPL